jgi:hypothetical protein
MTPTWQENLSAELDRFEERVAGISHDDDDTPAMPTLEDALARLAMESPEAAGQRATSSKGRTTCARYGSGSG